MKRVFHSFFTPSSLELEQTSLKETHLRITHFNPSSQKFVRLISLFQVSRRRRIIIYLTRNTFFTSHFTFQNTVALHCMAGVMIMIRQRKLFYRNISYSSSRRLPPWLLFPEPSVSNPRICRRTGLTSLEESRPRLMLDITNTRMMANLDLILFGCITWPGLERVYSIQWGRIPHPLYHLPVCNQEYIRVRCDLIQEFHETLPMMDSVKPGWVIEESKGSPIRVIMSFKVANKHFLNPFFILRIRTGISHWTPASIKVLPHDHGDLP